MARQSPDVEAICQRYWPMVMRRCRQLLRDEDRALDVAQDVFIQLLRHKARLDVQYPSSLLYRIATNLSLNRIRDERRRPASAEDDFLDQIATVEDHGATIEARSVLARLFAGHRESTRVIAVLHYVDGLTLEEVAGEVGMSVSGVRKRLRGLRQSLRDMEES